MHRRTTSRIQRVVTFGLGVVVPLLLLAGTAAATPVQGTGGGTDAPQQSSGTHDCNGTHHRDTGNGANTTGSYDSTCDGSASANGNGAGEATGRPCAGCVGNADDKNPPGQSLDGSDRNNGYECNGDAGVAKTNPAHTACSAPETSTEGSDGSQSPPAPVDEVSTPDVPPPVVSATETDKAGDPSTPGVVPTDEGAVLGESFAAGRSPGAPEAAPAVAAAVDAPVAAAPVVAKGRPAEVLGVQYSRSESSGLAFTGAPVMLLSLIGLVLCLAGGGLVLVSRKDDDTVSVAARPAGL